MYRRSPAESDHLLYYPQFRNICQAGILIFFSVIYFSVIYFSEKVAQAVSLQSAGSDLDVHMLRHTLIITIINALYRLTVDTDGMAWMRQRITERLSSLSLLRKALAAGAVTITGMLTSHHDVSLAAQTVLIIGTIFHNTF